MAVEQDQNIRHPQSDSCVSIWGIGLKAERCRFSREFKCPQGHQSQKCRYGDIAQSELLRLGQKTRGGTL